MLDIHLAQQGSPEQVCSGGGGGDGALMHFGVGPLEVVELWQC
jgi:hypothetical protein